MIQESGGKAAPVRTFQDMLKDPHDAALFEYYCTSQLAVVTPTASGPTVQNVGKPAIHIGSDPSPDGQFVLVARAEQAVLVPAPVLRVPAGGRGVPRPPTGRRPAPSRSCRCKTRCRSRACRPARAAIRWVPTMPHTLIWAEARDDGDPKKKVPHRDAAVHRRGRRRDQGHRTDEAGTPVRGAGLLPHRQPDARPRLRPRPEVGPHVPRLLDGDLRGRTEAAVRALGAGPLRRPRRRR